MFFIPRAGAASAILATTIEEQSYFSIHFSDHIYFTLLYFTVLIVKRTPSPQQLGFLQTYFFQY
jgi:hypothetical protein